jgi:hypothetical protein
MSKVISIEFIIIIIFGVLCIDETLNAPHSALSSIGHIECTMMTMQRVCYFAQALNIVM